MTSHRLGAPLVALALVLAAAMLAASQRFLLVQDRGFVVWRLDRLTGRACVLTGHDVPLSARDTQQIREDYHAGRMTRDAALAALAALDRRRPRFDESTVIAIAATRCSGSAWFSW